MNQEEYKIGDKVNYKDINITTGKYENSVGYIIFIKNDGSFIVGNTYVPYNDVVNCMTNPFHPLNRLSLVCREEIFIQNGGVA